MQEEIRPVLPVLTYSDLETEVIAKVRAGEALSLYIFSRNRREIRKVLRRFPSAVA